MEPGNVRHRRRPIGLEKTSVAEKPAAIFYMDHGTDKFEKSHAVRRYIPIQPGQFVVLAVGVIVSLLGMADFIPGQHHRYAGGEEQSRHEVSFLLGPQGDDRLVIGRSLGTAIPAVIVVRAVLVVFTIGVVVFSL